MQMTMTRPDTGSPSPVTGALSEADPSATRSGGSAGDAPARPHRASTQAYPEADRGATTARLLAELHQTDDEVERKALRAEVVVLNMGVARAIAHRYRQRGLAEDDLVQAAYVGLVKAVNGFDPSHERDFLSYAVPTVTGEVKRYFRDFGWSVRPPRRVQELQGSIAKASSELTQRLGHSPRPSEVAEALGIDVESVIEALAADGAFTPASLDVPVGEDGAATLGDLMPGEEVDFASAEARVVLGPAVRALAPRDRRILELRFFEGWTQEQIARDIGVTQMQVSRLLSRILRDLRSELT
jgi:RNA polymerase sigma-B factor